MKLLLLRSVWVPMNMLRIAINDIELKMDDITIRPDASDCLDDSAKHAQSVLYVIIHERRFILLFCSLSVWAYALTCTWWKMYREILKPMS